MTFAQRSTALSQDKPSIENLLSRAGVFFRADAPWALRNREDAYLPVYFEIINGVEKAAHSQAAALAKEVSRQPLKLKGLNIYVKPSGAKHQFAEEPLRLGASQDFSFDARRDGRPLSIVERMRKTLEIPRPLLEGYLKQHYLGGPVDAIDLWVSFELEDWPSPSSFLRVRLNAPPLPQIANWYRGDVHYHSAFTDNPAERGYPLGFSKQAALDAGVNWLVLADHSTDLDPEKFAEEMREAATTRDGRFLFIRGEEVTVASAQRTSFSTLHLLAFPSPDDPDRGFPDPAGESDRVIMTGDGSLPSPAMPLQEALGRIAAAGGFAYAAHPFDPISPLLRGGAWDLNRDFLSVDRRTGGERLQPALMGLEPWNRATMNTADDARDPYCIHRDADPSACFQPDKQANQYARLEKGIEQGWLPLLRKGLELANIGADGPVFKVFLAAGSDAHGDTNYESTLDVVDFLSKPSRGLSGYAEDNALGKLATAVYCPAGMGRRGENVLLALRAGQSVLTNGPLLIAGFDMNSNGSLEDAQDIRIGQKVSIPENGFPPLQLEWASSEEFGPLISLRMFVGSAEREFEPIEIPVPSEKGLASGGLYPLNLRAALKRLVGAWGYLRLETRAQNGSGEEFRCYTNPIWVREVRP